jgi:hypothetical protein
LLFSGFLTLFVIPAIYSFISKEHQPGKDEAGTAAEQEKVLHAPVTAEL